MKRLAGVLAFLPLLAGCFSAQPSVEGYHDRVLKGMDKAKVRWEIGEPVLTHPIPGQGAAADLPIEQWRYEWNYQAARTLTIVITIGIGLIWMDKNPYGFDVGFGRDGKVCVISEVGRRPR